MNAIPLHAVRRELIWCASKSSAWFRVRDRKTYSTYARTPKHAHAV